MTAAAQNTHEALLSIYRVSPGPGGGAGDELLILFMPRTPVIVMGPSFHQPTNWLAPLATAQLCPVAALII